ncbi:hypothetical protein C882_0093 [Caenispirillum salinarum AK4]|uniref:DUF4336 domain-containing protein n=1 Tax=Caenispirillum salinarum AK4 TaxID=1238182 RepID=K9GXM1_9PROT|nr:hypothetical protein [Caenispirillum salinarum]EKV30012.1 hypothetical protein C882_0093 [Caenispirillum salinarum AK4]
MSGLPEPLADGLWTVERRFRTMGLPVSSRGTLVRLPDGGLVVINPPRLDRPLREAVDWLGWPAHIVCPNRFHHLFAGDWKEAWPSARLWAAPGLEDKRRDLFFDARLGRQPPPWDPVLATLPIAGMPRLSEVWFLHRPSGTLIVTDLAARVGARQPWFLRAWSRLNGAGASGRVGSAAWLRLLVADDEALAASLNAAVARNPQQLVVAHGDPMANGVVPALRHALSRVSPAFGHAT